MQNDPRGTAACPVAGGVGPRRAVRRSKEPVLIKRIVLAAAVATALGSAMAPASAGEACLTTDVNVNGTALPTNGEQCVEIPEP